MKLRAPAYPLINIDPYFSIWSMSDTLNDTETRHWTGHPNAITGVAVIDGKRFVFMGQDDSAEKMEQISVDVNAMTTTYQFKGGDITLTAAFTSPLFLDDLKLASRPVTYMKIGTDANGHDVKIEITLDDEICLNEKYEFSTHAAYSVLENCTFGKVGSTYQGQMLRYSGDDRRINWGYACLAVNDTQAKQEIIQTKNDYGTLSENLRLTAGKDSLFTFAYDDVKCMRYFGDQLTSVWNKDGKTIEEAVCEAINEYDGLKKKCDAFSEALYEKALRKGGEKYAQILALAYRQAINAHKICVDTQGSILFISKECFSNGCAATVDVTYPSIPLFLLYNPELVKGMLRPVFKYAKTEEWFYAFAPHDAGQYPIVEGQVYGNGTTPKYQMPIEECGNMLVATASVCLIEKNIAFAEENWELLETWCQYLLENGLDPNNQLCTDDFAGHLAHNCNLSVKAIMGVTSFGLLCKMKGDEAKGQQFFDTAKDMAAKWIKSAANGDGTFRLAFDQPDSYSMKYNAVWDKLFKTGIFPDGVFKEELQAHLKKHSNKYGLVLDNRATYTKSDWLVWTATMLDSKADFEEMVSLLWDAYNESESRVPMTDFYNTETGKMEAFQNRSVQGGLFIKLLEDVDFSL